MRKTEAVVELLKARVAQLEAQVEAYQTSAKAVSEESPTASAPTVSSRDRVVLNGIVSAWSSLTNERRGLLRSGEYATLARELDAAMQALDEMGKG
jgi:hypothetical protein